MPPFEFVIGATYVCARNAGRVHCSDLADPKKPLLREPAVGNIDDAVSVALGRNFGCIATRRGTVSCFGDNTFGQLGAGLRAERSAEPVPVVGVRDAWRVVAGPAHACAITARGRVQCWGRNESGQTGNDTEYLEAARELVSASEVRGVQRATTVAASFSTTCATTEDGDVSCWGQAQLADHEKQRGTANEEPLRVPSLSGFEELAAGESAICGVRRGSVDCWGEAWSLLSDNGSNPKKPAMTGVSGAKKVRVAISHACALLANGAITCWGANHQGALGRAGGESFRSQSAAVVEGLPTAVDLAVGWGMSCAITASRRVYCWGTWPSSAEQPRKEPTPVELPIDG